MLEDNSAIVPLIFTVSYVMNSKLLISAEIDCCQFDGLPGSDGAWSLSLRVPRRIDETCPVHRFRSGDGGLFGSGAAAGDDRGENPRRGQTRAGRSRRA